ncbi:MAG: hypothetical protein U0R26_10980 [Solirubrobacterales bacterium]
MGVAVLEACAAHDELAAAGIDADLVVLTSADLVFRALRSRRGLEDGNDAILDSLFPADRAAPGRRRPRRSPAHLAFLAAVNGTATATLGVDDFGQSGDVGDLYEHFGIDTETIVGAAIDLIA